MSWIPVTLTIAALVTSCVGLGYLGASRVRRREWPRWAEVMMSSAAACLWPVIAVASLVYIEAPGILFGAAFAFSPLIFIIGYILTRVGSFIARGGMSDEALQ